MPSDNPTALVLLASEQLWPNIHSIEHWGAGLRRVFIYHTPDQPRSAEPARKLARFCKERHKLEATLAQGDAIPEALTSQIGRWLKMFSDESWLINATGGTKLMYDGAAAFRGRPGVRVVYRELGPNNLWYELGRDVDGNPTVKPIIVPPEVTDRIPIQLLLRTLWETDTLNLTFGPDPKPLPFPDIGRALIETNGNWREAFARVNVPLADKESGGVPFERYVAAALIEMGMTNLAHSVKQEGLPPEGSGGRARPTQEIDIVANHGARLLVFDCKLRTEEDEGREVEGITSQIRQAAQTTRRLGGLGAEVVLLRPNREIAGTILALARDLRVRVIDKGDRGCFFQKLAEFVGCPALPESLRRTDELLADPANALRAFPPTAGLRRLAAATGGGPVVDLERLSGDWARELGQDWAVVRLQRELHQLQYANHEGFSRDRLKDAIRVALEQFGPDIQVEVTNTGNTLFALVAVAQESAQSFRDFLTSRVGKPLLE